MTARTRRLNHSQRSKKLIFWTAIIVPLCAFSFYPVVLLSSSSVRAAATPQSTPTFDRLAEPTLPANPGQADLGAVAYWFTCMVCHGDRGQGLTEEWRAASGPEDMNCWQSRCHASNHPPEGFVLPQYAPAVIGESALQGFDTAAELYTFISSRMPWQAPGVLDEETYWQLTSYLLRENGLPVEDPLGPQNANQVFFAAPSSTQTPTTSLVVLETPEPTAQVAVDDFRSGEGGPSISILLCAFGLVLLLGGITWPVLISRRRREEK